MERVNTFQFGEGRLICPDGRTYEIYNIRMEIKQELPEYYDEAGRVIHLGTPKLTTINLGESFGGQDQSSSDVHADGQKRKPSFYVSQTERRRDSDEGE